MHAQTAAAPDPGRLIAGAAPSRPMDALFVSAPLRDYAVRPRVNDFTLPVLGMAYIATCAAQAGYNVGVLDAEAAGLGITEAARLVNEAAPRWAGPGSTFSPPPMR
jgi:anaerobic magnesium-protoporphyrin IX monomethyl ester cyclase